MNFPKAEDTYTAAPNHGPTGSKRPTEPACRAAWKMNLQRQIGDSIIPL